MGLDLGQKAEFRVAQPESGILNFVHDGHAAGIDDRLNEGIFWNLAELRCDFIVPVTCPDADR